MKSLQLDSEIARLEHAKSLLTGATDERGPGTPRQSARSLGALARISAGQRKRWVKAKKQAK